MKVKVCLAITLISVGFGSVFARYGRTGTFDVEITGGYGISGFSTENESGLITNNGNVQFVVNGIYYLSESLGLGFGSGYSRYSNVSQLNSFSSKVSAVDAKGVKFEYRVSAARIEESQSTGLFEIPIFVAYRVSVLPDNGLISRKKQKGVLFFADAGLKLSVPIQSDYKCTKGIVETKGYYSQTNAEITNNSDLGFGVNRKISFAGELPTQLATSLCFDLGLSVPVQKKHLLLGLYMTSGLGSIIKFNGGQLVIYKDSYQSIASVRGATTLTQMGVKLGVGF